MIGENGIDSRILEILKRRSVNNGSVNILGVNIFNSDSLLLSDIFLCLGALADDTNTPGDGGSSDGMISGNHDNLDSSRLALSDGIGDTGSGRINHGHETDEDESFQREVDLFVVEFEALGELLGIHLLVAESEDTFSESSELFVGGLELDTVFAEKGNRLVDGKKKPGFSNLV